MNKPVEVSEDEILAIGMALLLELRPNINRFGSIDYTELFDGNDLVCENQEQSEF